MFFEALLQAKKVYVIMALLALWLGCTPCPSFALPVGSFENTDTATQDRATIDAFLAQHLVSQRLAAMGLSKDEIAERLDRLSDGEIHQLAQRLDRIKAGGDGWVIALIVVLIIIGAVFFFMTHTLHVEPREKYE
jgi:hypothetical protein